MAAAEVGDDVYGEDPTVNRLEERVAALLGKEAALFVPSGTMSNQIAVKTHTQPGDELICEEFCHIYNWEAGGPAFLSGVTCRTVRAEYGILDLDQTPRQDSAGQRPHGAHAARLPGEHAQSRRRPHLSARQGPGISAWARSNKLADAPRRRPALERDRRHRRSGREWGKHFDTISVCFSKGLGAPVGSALAGPADFITRARRYRKIFGGAMRQAGVLAAAAASTRWIITSTGWPRITATPK